MVSISALWLPILLSAVIVFIASSIIHMLLTYHRSDLGKLPGEDRIRQAIRESGAGPGDYFIPHCASMKEMGTPEMVEKFNEGPVGLMTLKPNGPPTMGKALVLWFINCLVVSVFAAYLTSRTLEAGAQYLAVFRIAGTTAFLGYSVALLQVSIWKWQAWSTTFKNIFDGLIYALLTAGVFGWLWPG